MKDVIGPGSTIGILGAGQLGRMLAVVARQMGYNVVVFGGDRTSPAGQVADRCWPGDFADQDQLREFASAADVVSYEFENIPAAAAAVIAEQTLLRPGVELLSVAQNRFAEKTALTKMGLPTAGFRMVASADELSSARVDFGGNVILKANTDGYDGKGQWAISSETDVAELWKTSGLKEGLVEERIDFEFELSAIGGRYADGTTRLFAPSLNHHSNHILDVSVSGTNLITPPLAERASEMAQTVLDHFDVIGVLCLELFSTRDGQLVVNEIAPRPHNSGHLTIEAYNCSQFELQLRTICNLPAVPLNRRTPVAVMANLLGQHVPEQWATQSMTAFETPETHLHLYGKGAPRHNRKVGHLTIIGDSEQDVELQARQSRMQLTAE